jgi:TorA maturation chaperone TorD
METRDLFEWLTIAPTDLGSCVRRVLWRVFFVRNDDHLCQQLEEAKKQAEEAKKKSEDAEKKAEDAEKKAEEAEKASTYKVSVCLVYICK